MFRTLLAIPAAVGHTVGCGLAALATAPVLPNAHEPIIQFWARGLNAFCGVRLSVAGDDHLDARRRYVFMANHQSLIDIPVLSAAIPNPLRYIAKRELTRVPLFGQAMQAVGTIAIDRADRTAALRAIERAQFKVAQQFSLLFFAEGTRSPDGVLRPFKRGGVATAQSLGVPLVPVAVAGTRAVMRKGSLAIHGGRVHVEIGAPVEADASPELRDALIERMQRDVAALLQRAQMRVSQQA